jgi:hypothetical protein
VEVEKDVSDATMLGAMAEGLQAELSKPSMMIKEA